MLKKILILSIFNTILSIISEDFDIKFNNPQNIPYLWKKVTNGKYSTWTTYGFDKKQDTLWIKYFRRPISYMFYKLIKLNSKNFYQLNLGYRTKLPVYFSIYMIYIDKNFKQRGYQIIYNDKLAPKNNNISLEFKPLKAIKRAIFYISIQYISKISKLYISNISLKKIEKIYSNLDDLYIVPYKKEFEIKICAIRLKRDNALIQWRLTNIIHKQKYISYSFTALFKGKMCKKQTINIASGLYKFEYSIISQNNNTTISKQNIIWISPNLKKTKKLIYAYNTYKNLYIKTIPFISFLKRDNINSDSIMLEPFLYDGVFSKYYPVNSHTFFNSNFSKYLINNFKNKHGVKNFFILDTDNNNLQAESTQNFIKYSKYIAGIYFLNSNSLKNPSLKVTIKFPYKKFLFLNTPEIDLKHISDNSILIINYENFKKFLPLVFLKVFTYKALHISEPYFSNEYNFFINKDRTITTIKYSETPIQMDLLPVEQILTNFVIDISSFGYKTNKKIYILKFQGELPSSIIKTKNSVLIYPRSFYLPIDKIRGKIQIHNFFNEDLYIKQLLISSEKEWEININNVNRIIKNGNKIIIPFSIIIPPLTPISKHSFFLHIKLEHKKIGDIEIKKFFTLSIKNKEFDFKRKIKKEQNGFNIIFEFRNKKRKKLIYNIAAVQPPDLLKEEIVLTLQPRKKESTYLKLKNVKRKKSIIFSIKNALTGNFFFIEIPIK